MRWIVRLVLNIYRVLSYVTGIGLVLLVFVAVPLQIFADNDGPVQVIGALHGFLFMGYVVAVLALSAMNRWSLPKTAMVAVAGTVPFAVFFAERRVVADAARAAVPPDRS
jgi:integral membrane protein